MFIRPSLIYILECNLKELQKLLKQINDKKNEVKSLVNDGKLDKAKAAKEELKELNR